MGLLGLVASVCGWNLFVSDTQDGWVSGWYIGVVVSSITFFAGVLLAIGTFDDRRHENDPHR